MIKKKKQEKRIYGNNNGERKNLRKIKPGKNLRKIVCRNIENRGKYLIGNF